MLATPTLLAAAAFSPAFELEVGSGVAHSLETDLGYEYPLVVPAIQGRTAIDFPPGLALGGMFLAVVGGEAPNRHGMLQSHQRLQGVLRDCHAVHAAGALVRRRPGMGGGRPRRRTGIDLRRRELHRGDALERSRDRRRESFLSSRRQRATIHGLRYSADHTSVRAS